jgi:outer membrane usher protein FimD/PapC
MFRGAQIFSDDTMLPESMRGFAPVIRGIARTNATVTVKQNGYTVYQTYVAPGSFEIRDLYPTSASGDLDIVVTEADGSVQHFVQPFSAVPVMLREGRVKYALSAGSIEQRSMARKPLIWAGHAGLWPLQSSHAVRWRFGGEQLCVWRARYGSQLWRHWLAVG